MNHILRITVVTALISMTAPVGQQRVAEGWTISFMTPDSYTLETLPVPTNPKVTLRQVPARRMAAVQDNAQP